MDVVNDFGIQKMVVTKIFGKLRTLVGRYFVENPIRLGGPGKVCQIDESLFVHRTKYNRGRWPSEQVWVFGVVDTSISPARFCLKIVPNRTKNTLYPVITDVCKPGTTIYSDSWAAYFGIQNMLGFSHEMVNHKLYFVQPETGVNTQTVESWNRIKRKIKAMCGVKKSQLPGFLEEVMFKNEFKENVLGSLAILLAAKHD